jgi:hypothetical protein
LTFTLGNGEDDLAVRNIQEQGLPHPFAPLLQAFGMAGRAEPPRLAGERQQVFPVTLRAADPGEARAGIAAVEVTLDDFPDDRPEIPVFPLEAPLVFDEEQLEMMEQYAVEDRALRMARTVDSRHIGNPPSKSVPKSPLK